MQTSKEFAVLFAVLFLPGMVSQGLGVDPAAWEHASYHVALLSVAIPQALLVVYVTELRTPGAAVRLGWRRPRWSDLVSAAMALFLVLAAVTLASGIASLVTDGAAFESAVRWRFTRLGLLPLLLLSSTATGYREEIFYRAYFVVRGEDLGANPAAVIAVSTILFALGHLYQGVAGFVLALVIGAVFAGVFLRGRSLHGIAVAHGLYNAIVLVLSSPLRSS